MTEDQVLKPILRAALPGDIPAMCDLFLPESARSADREKKAEELRPLLGPSDSSALFVAVQDGHVRGLCSIQTVISAAEGGPAGIVENLIVHPDHQGQGIGGSLLGSVMTWCTKQGITRMQLPACRDNVPALQVYFSRGWTGTGSIRLKNGF